MFNFNVPVLNYHSISNDNSFVSLNIKEFEFQMSLLKKYGYRTVFFNEINPIDKNQIIITFDDAYKDIIFNALPILSKYNFKAICYVVSNFIGKNNQWDAKRKDYITKDIMNENDLKLWITNGMHIGSHSNNHYDLTKLNRNELDYELSKSKEILESITSKEVTNFCYPYGRLNSATVDGVSKIYSTAVTTNRSRYYPKKHNSYKIPRIDMGQEISSLKIFLKLKTFYEDIKYKNDL